jgi:hypothetical protein
MMASPFIESSSAARSEPGPLSARLVTVRVTPVTWLWATTMFTLVVTLL